MKNNEVIDFLSHWLIRNNYCQLANGIFIILIFILIVFIILLVVVLVVGGEETGLEPDQVELLEEFEPWLFYDFPPALKAKLTGPYYGQRQKWFAYRFTGSDTDFRLDRHTVEFDAWKWAKLEDAPGLVIPFKAAVYAEIAKGFVRWTAPV